MISMSRRQASLDLVELSELTFLLRFCWLDSLVLVLILISIPIRSQIQIWFRLNEQTFFLHLR